MVELARAVHAAAIAQWFSGAVRVILDGEVALETAYGAADRAGRLPNTVDTRFAIASGTKLLTALGVRALVDDGALAVDARLRDVVRAPLPNVSPDVTIRHLLTHTSGVYDYYDEELVDDFDAFELPIAPFRLERPADYLPLLTAGAQKFAPGARFSYSNSGYVLLGLVIEEVAGAGYHQVIDERVLRPAGMHASGFFRFDALPDRTATGYVETAGGWRSNIYALPVIGGPDGGAYSTLADIERLWQAVLTRPGAHLTRAAHWKDQIHYGEGVWIEDDGVAPPRYYVEGCDAGVSFRSTCHRPGAIATVMSNTTDGAWPVHAAIDRCLAEREPGS